MSIDLCPKVCNICGGEVEYIEIKQIYGPVRKYKTGSGYCYHCKKCGALVSTHKDRPLEAMGLLADKEMSELRQKAHQMFDRLWKTRKERTEMYQKLANELQIPFEECHFAYFTKEQLKQTETILVKLWREKYDR